MATPTFEGVFRLIYLILKCILIRTFIKVQVFLKSLGLSFNVLGLTEEVICHIMQSFN